MAGRLYGVNFHNWAAPSYGTTEADASLDLLASYKANAVAILVTAHQATAQSTDVGTGSRTPKDTDLRYTIRRAQSLGLRVMLKAHVEVDDGAPSSAVGQFRTEPLWVDWFRSYGAFVGKLAVLADEERVDLLCIGTELGATSRRSDDWTRLIHQVRLRYGGALTYAALPYIEDCSIDWWDHLDYIGVDAYYNLTDQIEARPHELALGWHRWAVRLSELWARWRRPILLTEIGYRNLVGTNRSPGDWRTAGTADQLGQARCYDATFRSLQGCRWLAGLFWWDWNTNPAQGSATRTDYTPANRLAGDVMRNWFGRDR